MEKEIRAKLAKNINSKLNELNSVESMEQLIKDNKIEFISKGITYRVRKSNYRETEIVRQERNMKKVELLQNPKYKLRSELIKIYRKNGKDIEKMESNITAFASKLEPIQERLAQSTAKKDIDLLKEELLKLEERQMELLLERNECLDGCIENQITEYANLYMVYLVTEKYTLEDKWIKAFKSYEEFMDFDDIIMQASNYLSLLVYRRDIPSE